MDYKDYIKAGEQVLYVPSYRNDWEEFWSDEKPRVVTISEYRPYATDGSPDPQPDELEGWHQVEVEGNVEDKQIPLARLFAIERKEDEVIYCGKVYQVYGYADADNGHDWDLGTRYCIMRDGDELTVVDEDDVHSPRTIDDLSHDELERLHGEIRRGSMYYDDYRNTLDVPDAVAMQAWEDFYNELYDEYGSEQAADEHDTPKEFADWYHFQLAA